MPGRFRALPPGKFPPSDAAFPGRRRSKGEKVKYFKFKDLVINVLPAQDPAKLVCNPTIRQCLQPSCACLSRQFLSGITACGTTPCWCLSHGLTPSPCASRICSNISPVYSPWCQVEDPSPIDLASLKEQLQQTLTQIEEQERLDAQALSPQTVDEAEQLEKKLNDALGELKTIKEDLRKKKA